MIRLLICEPTLMGCELLAGALDRADSEFEIVARVTGARELRSVFEQLKPHVVLISATLADGSLGNLKAIGEVRSRHPKTSVIVLLDSNNRELVVEAFRSGARGVFVRTEPVNILPKAIRSVHAGQIWANSKQLDYLLEALTAAAPFRILSAKGETLLSKRQQQLVALVAQGLTNHDIAERLCLSEHTVKNYLFRIFDKLGISTRTELILYVMSQRQSEPTPEGDAAA
jgi:DNA-binding NarL/FixJ family response regulator